MVVFHSQLWMTTLVPGDPNPAQRSLTSLVVLEDVVVAVTASRLFALAVTTGAVLRKEVWPSRMGSSYVRSCHPRLGPVRPLMRTRGAFVTGVWPWRRWTTPRRSAAGGPALRVPGTLWNTRSDGDAFVFVDMLYK